MYENQTKQMAKAVSKNDTVRLKHRLVTSLGHQERRRVFPEGPKLFELCPIFLNCVQHILPGGRKIFRGG